MPLRVIPRLAASNRAEAVVLQWLTTNRHPQGGKRAAEPRQSAMYDSAARNVKKEDRRSRLSQSTCATSEKEDRHSCLSQNTWATVQRRTDIPVCRTTFRKHLTNNADGMADRQECLSSCSRGGKCRMATIHSGPRRNGSVAARRRHRGRGWGRSALKTTRERRSVGRRIA